MDVYRALHADVPHMLFAVTHQAGSAVTAEEYERVAVALLGSIREQAQEAGEELHHWLERQYSEQAGETARKLQMLGLLPTDVDLERIQQALAHDYMRLGNRLGSSSMVGLQGSGEEVFSEQIPGDPELAERVARGREYLSSLGFRPGQSVLHESWLLFRGSIHYDILEHMARHRLGIYKGTYGDLLRLVERVSFGTYNLVYQLGEDLTVLQPSGVEAQEVTFAFSKDAAHYSPFRQEVSGLMEHIAGQINLPHASFWQRKLGLGTGKEFVLRLRLPSGEAPLKEAISAIANSGRVGEETIAKRGKLLLGTRVM